jgi:CheY-like chemotaxis protein
MSTPIVLVVDDDADARRALSARIAGAGFQVAMARSGRGALSVLDELRPAAVVLDANMPDMSGPEVCRQIKERDWDRPVAVVFVSGASAPSPGYVRDCAEVAGGAYFFRKPVDHVRLLEVLADAVQDRPSLVAGAD